MSFPQKQHKLPTLKNIRLIHLLHKFISCLLGYFARAVTFMGIFFACIFTCFSIY